ncbi:hypothetical protein NX059_005461 [Plenodomus lindquistii]|nr:hypothetical protein NX059_005461 [Plenodomus lindquistii]
MPAIPDFPVVPGIHVLPDFSPALTQHDIQDCHVSLPHTLLIDNMLTLSTYLTTLDTQSNFFAPRNTSPYSPSLRVLHSRLENGYLNPSPLPTPFITPQHIALAAQPNTLTCDIRHRPLSDFQDLYYALLARIREMQKRLSDHLRSGFSTPTTTIHTSGPTLADLHAALSAHWDFLNHPAAGRAMDDAVREARVQSIQDEIVAQVKGNMMGVGEAETQIMQLREKEVYEMQGGVEWTPEWDAALVNAKLGEKYRGVFEEVRRRERKKRGKRGKGGVGEVKGVEGLGGEMEGRRAEVEWLGQVAQSQQGFHDDTDVDAQNQDQDIDRDEQEWLWQVEQMQHPAFRDDFTIDAQDDPTAELLRANAAQLRYIPDFQDDEPMKDIEVAQSVQHQQMQQLDGPSPVEEPDAKNVNLIDARTAWRRELQAQRQRVSQYTAYLRNRASTQADSMAENAG